VKNNIPFPPTSFEELVTFLTHVVDLFTLAEMVLAVLFIAIAAFAPRLGQRSFEKMERSFSAVSHHPVRQILVVGLLAVVCRAVLLPWLGVPIPSVYDEQSMALQAQTFMEGRLANPVHPFWEHFETYYVNQTPAYGSMYFPGRGAPLYAGLLLGGNAWIGVWLSMVLMCMAATWMLQAWVSLPMAFLGGVLVTARLGLFSFWINSYYGGAFIALGAMLVFGALPRILAAPRWRDGAVMALGTVILMVSRPYEGVLFCIPVGLAILARWIRPGWSAGRMALLRVALPVVLMTGAGGALLLAYNVATTGDPLKSAYTLQRETYAEAPAFLTSPPVISEKRGPAYFRTYYEMEAEAYHYRESAQKIVRSVMAKLLYTFNFYIGATFAIAFFAGLWAVRRNLFLPGTLLFFFAGYCLVTWNFPQYTSPVFPVLLVVIMRGFEWLRARDPVRHPAGLFLARAMATSGIVLVALPTVSAVSGVPPMPPTLQSVCCVLTRDKLRPMLNQHLAESPGRDLVFVRNGLQNPSNYELVANEANIDRADVVWAHSLSSEKDERLRKYYPDRKVWTFEWLPETDKKTEQGYTFKPLDGP